MKATAQTLAYRPRKLKKQAMTLAWIIAAVLQVTDPILLDATPMFEIAGRHGSNASCRAVQCTKRVCGSRLKKVVITARRSRNQNQLQWQNGELHWSSLPVPLGTTDRSPPFPTVGVFPNKSKPLWWHTLEPVSPLRVSVRTLLNFQRKSCC